MSSNLPLLPPAPALLGVVRVFPALVGEPKRTLGHKGPSATAPLGLSLSRAGGLSQAGPSFSPPPFPALLWALASLTSRSPHSHVGSWPIFLVESEWRAEAFSVSCWGGEL